MKHKPMTPEQQMQLSKWQRELYQKNNVSLTGGIGCLPLLIQMPIMMGIYSAVAYSSVLREASFFGISLNSKSLVLAIIATVFAVIQGYISLIGIPKEQKKTMQSMMFMNPIMTLFFSLSFSGALALYWAAGNFVTIIQQILVTFVITPRERNALQLKLKIILFKPSLLRRTLMISLMVLQQMLLAKQENCIRICVNAIKATTKT